MSTKQYPGRTALENYLTRTANSSLSYLGFLKSKRSLIVKTPPLSEDWRGLNVVEEDTRPYWEGVIDERKKNRVKETIRSKTIDIYQAVGENVGDEIVDECQQSSKRLKKDEQGQCRTRSVADYHADSEDNAESRDPTYVSENDDDLDTSDREAIDDQGEVKGAINDEGRTGPLRLSEANRKEIDTAYNLMDKQYMWKLSSGRFVEEELYKLGQGLEFEHAIHSFILDVEDESIVEHFTETELREIDSTSIPEVPELSDEIDEFLSKFHGKTNLNEIRQIIKESSFGNDYDHGKHHDLDYICLALHSLVRKIQNGSIKDMNLENWYNCHVWSVMFDQAFGDIKSVAVVRGESTSISTATRKNKKAKRKPGERRKIGRRGDWILRAVGNGEKDEFGAGEAGKDWVDEYGTKYLREIGLKLPKTLKDMLVNLIERIKWNEEMRKKIRTIGIIHAGLMMTIVYADNPKGYICRFQRCDPMEVPDTVENFDSVLTILASVLNAKSVVQETAKIVQTRGQATKSFKSVGLRKRPRDGGQHKLSACMSTPKKVKVCAKMNTRRSYPSSPCPGSPNTEPLI
ncbi:C2H2-type zinc finger transcription factor [Rhizophagus clarus]|uniref:C2H2-type zinc finger transcription factor n=1 Tax=Rhizophagus clarus TaxID=94130 RepID=A0A8H3LCE4_9GLOM|nr:C2H2-type zinc finger transcription factor [Rhizophagus clarus]